MPLGISSEIYVTDELQKMIFNHISTDILSQTNILNIIIQNHLNETVLMSTQKQIFELTSMKIITILCLIICI